MDEVTYVEVLGRHGEVVARHAAHRLPVKIGRAYGNDVILDDPYVAPYHAAVERSPAGDLELVDAGSRNGLFRVGDRAPLTRDRVDPDARYRVGRTELRIRASSHAVSPELPDHGGRGWRQAAIPVAAVLASAGMSLLYSWSTTYEQSDLAKLVLPPVLLVLALLLWAGAWSLAGRLLIGAWRLAGHLTAAALVVLAYFFVNNWDYLQFALSWSWLLYPGLVVLGAFVAWGLWRHLSLVIRNPGRGVAVAAVAVTAVSLGSFVLYSLTDREDELTRMAYLKAVKPPVVRLVSGREPGEFFQAAGRLRVEVESLKAR